MLEVIVIFSQCIGNIICPPNHYSVQFHSFFLSVSACVLDSPSPYTAYAVRGYIAPPGDGEVNYMTLLSDTSLEIRPCW